jgi:hypothetical protein
VRWKLIRRRLSVSAPRMIVRSRLPWPLRWVVVALALGFSAAIALWAFEFGREISGLDPRAGDEVVRLRAEVQALRAERDRAQSLANAADGLLKAERTAQERLALELRELEASKLALEADLGFFERLLPAGTQPMQLRALQAEAQAPGRTRYQMLVMQHGAGVAEFQGRYDIVLDGTLEGRPWSASLPGGARPLALQQYVRVQGLIDHPVQVVLKAVQARVTDLQGTLRASGTVRLQ